MPILTSHPPVNDRPTLKDDIPVPAKLASAEPLKAAEIRPESPKLKDKATEPVKKSLPADKPKGKLPTPEPEREVYKAVVGSEFYKLEECDQLPTLEEETFAQILELDDDPDDRDFSRGMADEFFVQAEATFKEMDNHLSARDFQSLSDKGHFLKGSSAALGLSRVQSLCEKIQHCGALRDERLDSNLTEGEALDVMQKLLKTVKHEYTEAEAWLRDFFENNRSLDL